MNCSKSSETKIPGYTGYQAQVEDNKDHQNYVGKTTVPGYSGYIPGVNSENVHGQTYGKSTGMSIRGEIARGENQENSARYSSTQQDSYLNYPTGYQQRDQAESQDERPKEVPQDVADKFYTGAVYSNSLHMSNDQRAQEELSLDKDAVTFYGDKSVPADKGEGEEMAGFGRATQQFYGEAHEGKVANYSDMKMTYEEARAQAYN